MAVNAPVLRTSPGRASRRLTGAALALIVAANAGVMVALWLRYGGLTGVHDTGARLTSIGRITGLLGASRLSALWIDVSSQRVLGCAQDPPRQRADSPDMSSPRALVVALLGAAVLAATGCGSTTATTTSVSASAASTTGQVGPGVASPTAGRYPRKPPQRWSRRSASRRPA